MKKPGDMQRARVRHKARQRLYDAVKILGTMKPGEWMEMRIHGRNVYVTPGDGDAGQHVIYVNNGRIGLGHVYKDLVHVFSETAGTGNLLKPDRIVGVVVNKPYAKTSNTT